MSFRTSKQLGLQQPILELEEEDGGHNEPAISVLHYNFILRLNRMKNGWAPSLALYR
jgi:hypothetical protein